MKSIKIKFKGGPLEGQKIKLRVEEVHQIPTAITFKTVFGPTRNEDSKLLEMSMRVVSYRITSKSENDPLVYQFVGYREIANDFEDAFG